MKTIYTINRLIAEIIRLRKEVRLLIWLFCVYAHQVIYEAKQPFLLRCIEKNLLTELQSLI